MASLIGRFIRTFVIMAVVLAISPVSAAWAAPFAAHVMDARTGETLYEKNANSRLHPASLTKMMTLYIAFEEIAAGRLSLDTKVTISKHAAAQPPSRLGLKPGQKIALRFLIRAAAVKSANDAATAIGEHIAGGSEAAFAKRMTRTAKAIGMSSTTFRNANGLTAEGHLSTAHDMSVMGRRLFYDFPQFYNIFSRRTADAGVAEVRNTNSRFLDSYKGADGIKTGFTNPAGFNLTASAERGNTRIIATVFGGTSTAQRNAKVAELLDIGFRAAPSNAPVKKPAAPAYDAAEEALIADADADAIARAVADAAQMDEPDVSGGAAKTIRVSGGVLKSLRPKARPMAGAPEMVVAEAPVEAPAEAPAVQDDVALAIAEGVAGALAEAAVPEAPPGTLEAQAAALAEADPMAETPPQGTLEAQALALADAAPTDTAPADVPANTLEAQALALAAPAEQPVDTALADARPKLRPDTQPEVPADTELAAAPVEEAQAPEMVVTDAGQPEAIETPVDTAPTELVQAEPEVMAVEEVVGATNAAPAPIALAAAIQPAKRKAPIFDKAATPAPVAEETEEQEVVVRMSTSGGRHFGVNVGNFTSRSEAERALLKTALAESATLNGGLRKITQKGGSYRANFMGLTEDQAELACRRLRARAVECETLG